MLKKHLLVREDFGEQVKLQLRILKATDKKYK